MSTDLVNRNNDELTLRDTNHDNDNIEEPEVTPLPKLQLLIIFLVQFAEPVTATVIYPFVNQFVRATGITGGDERKTGYYAGVIESAFFFAECLTVVLWGYLADCYGRRPILLFGPLGLALAVYMFGLSTSFWPLVFWRCLQGAFNGNIGVSKSVIAEVTDSTNVGDAYAMIPFMWSTGITTGPVLGGILADPASRWPSTLGRIPILRTHPYFLPCAAVSLISFITFVIAAFGLRETLPSLVAQEQRKERQNYPTDDIGTAPVTDQNRLVDHAENVEYGSTGRLRTSSESLQSSSSAFSRQSQPTSPVDTIAEKVGIRSLVLGPLLVPLVNYTFLAFLDTSHSVLLPLMYSSSISLGGLGLDPFRIGSALAAFAVVNSFVQINVLGRCIRKFGARKMYIFSFASIIVCFIMYPILNIFARRAGGIDAPVLICMFIQLGFQMAVYMAYGSMQVLIVQSVPEGGPLATVNGVAQMVASGMRSIAPTFASSLFSISLTRQLAGGNMVYYVLSGLTLTGIRLSILLPMPPPKRTSSPGQGLP